MSPNQNEPLKTQQWRMLSSTATYAIRAVAYIARHSSGGGVVAAVDVAQELGVPQNYLSKVLGVLARAGILQSTRGIGGGFKLVRPATETTLAAVIAPFDLFGERPSCLLRDGLCNPEDPCIAHHGWKEISENIRAYFRQTTIQDLIP